MFSEVTYAHSPQVLGYLTLHEAKLAAARLISSTQTTTLTPVWERHDLKSIGTSNGHSKMEPSSEATGKNIHHNKHIWGPICGNLQQIPMHICIYTSYSHLCMFMCGSSEIQNSWSNKYTYSIAAHSQYPYHLVIQMLPAGVQSGPWRQEVVQMGASDNNMPTRMWRCFVA